MQTAALRTSVIAALALAYGLLGLSGCKTFSRAMRPSVVAEAQSPGVASGAGGTVTQPGNSAAPTTQVSERRTAYFPPAAIPTPAPPSVTLSAPAVQPVAATPASQTVAPLPAAPPMPAWTYERTETTLGQHQDAAGIMKAAATMNTWGTMKWLGLGAIVFAVAALLWSAGHEEGYPLVYVKIGGCGVFFMLCGDNPFWLLLLLLPLGFWAVQKFGLWKIPGT